MTTDILSDSSPAQTEALRGYDIVRVRYELGHLAIAYREEY